MAHPRGNEVYKVWAKSEVLSDPTKKESKNQFFGKQGDISEL